jgi:hypothetical protein
MDAVTTTETAANAVQQSGSSAIPDSTLVGVAASVLAAVIVYSVRQYWEKKKIRRALLSEVSQMHGLQECADQMDRVEEPPGRQIRPDDVPAADSIPTTIYQNSSGKIGLLNSFQGDELEPAVKFYSQAMRYKDIINNINSSESVSDTDQEDLYDNISKISDWQSTISNDGKFEMTESAEELFTEENNN